MNWKRSITDPIGQVWTPFASLRGDVAIASIDSQPGVANYVATGNTEVGRLMPTAGIEYRYPFINVQSWGTTTVVAGRSGHRAAERAEGRTSCRTRTPRA